MSDALQNSRKDLRHALPTSAGARERLVYIRASSISIGNLRCTVVRLVGSLILQRRQRETKGDNHLKIRSGCHHCDRIHLLLGRSSRWSVCLLLSCSGFQATAMTLLITFSWRFLLTLSLERARRLRRGVAPNPAKVGLGVRKCPYRRISHYVPQLLLSLIQAIDG
jgi:hypothetical protein